MMMSQSLYRTLKAQHPDCVIDVMAPAWCRPLLELMPEVHSAIAMPIGHGRFALTERRALGKQLQAEGYDQAIVLPNSFKSALIPFLPRSQPVPVGAVKCAMVCSMICVCWIKPPFP